MLTSELEAQLPAPCGAAVHERSFSQENNNSRMIIAVQVITCCVRMCLVVYTVDNLVPSVAPSLHVQRKDRVKGKHALAVL